MEMFLEIDSAEWRDVAAKYFDSLSQRDRDSVAPKIDRENFSFAVWNLQAYGYLDRESLIQCDNLTLLVLREAVRVYRNFNNLGDEGIISVSVLRDMSEERCAIGDVGFGTGLSSMNALAVKNQEFLRAQVCRWKGAAFKYLIDGLSEGFKNEFENAIKAWNVALSKRFKFEMTTNLDKAEVVVAMRAPNETDIGYGLARPRVAHADYPPNDCLRCRLTKGCTLPVHFRMKEENFPEWNAERIFNVALHEIGHVLGLSHYQVLGNSGSIMEKGAKWGAKKWSLKNDPAVGEVKWLYGFK